MTVAFHIDNLRHDKGGRTVLAIPSLALEGPGLIALVGHNGAGKTTLLRLLTGLLEVPTAGSVRCSVDPLSVGLVDQSPYLFTTTVAANVGYGLKVRGVPRWARTERVRTALDEVGLAGFEKRRARELSGGERRRVAVARALVVNPRVLLLDEPDAGLDTAAVAGLERLISRVAEQRLVIFSTHDRERARRLAHRVVYLEKGRLVHRVTAVNADSVMPGSIPTRQP